MNLNYEAACELAKVADEDHVIVCDLVAYLDCYEAIVLDARSTKANMAKDTISIEGKEGGPIVRIVQNDYAPVNSLALVPRWILNNIAELQAMLTIEQNKQSDAKKQPIPAQQISQGRIVLYNHPGSADGKYKPTTSPAMVQSVLEDGGAILFVFGPKGQHQDGPIYEGEGPCQWMWPPRI